MIREVIELFLERLPNSVPFQVLHHKVMERIDLIQDDDVTEFIRISNEALDIDSLYRHANPLQTTLPPRSSPSIPRATTTPSTSASAPVPTPPVPAHSRSHLVCSNNNCGATGHTIDTCFKVRGGLEGQRDAYLAKQKGAQAHLAQFDEFLASHDRAQAFLLHIEDILQGDEDPSAVVSTSSVPSPTVEYTPDPVPTFSALSIPTSEFSVNDDVTFDLYLPSSFKTTAYSALSPTLVDLCNVVSPSAFAVSSEFPFNSLLDSGCTHYIIQDRVLFWTYDTTRATPVKTANCGFLQTLARGTVRFRVVSGGRTVTFILNDCLHAPDAPINLISVGALTEKDAVFTFRKDVTTISFPHDHPVLPSFSFHASVLHRLSFLNCDFIRPSASPVPPLCDPPSPLLEVLDLSLSATFPPVSLTPELWHRRLGHLGLEATRAVLTKDYPVWHAAMEREMDSLRSRNAFEPAVLPKGHKPIDVRWVYAYKYNPDGTIIHGKEKARLVAQGFSQRSEDFDETYAPVAKMTSIHIILAFAAVNDLEIMASDVKTAFLHCRLRSDIYCQPIPGQPPPSEPGTVLRILVALYGLHMNSICFLFTHFNLWACNVVRLTMLFFMALGPFPPIHLFPLCLVIRLYLPSFLSMWTMVSLSVILSPCITGLSLNSSIQLRLLTWVPLLYTLAYGLLVIALVENSGYLRSLIAWSFYEFGT